MSIDRSSPTWLALQARALERIEDLKERCCLLGTSDAERAACASRIDELRRLLAPNTALDSAPSAYRSESY